MKNCRILQVMPDFGLAGAEIMCENLVYELAKVPNCQVFVVSLFNQQTAITNRLISKGVKVFFLSKKKGFDFSLIKQLKAIMIEYKINIVHTHRYVMQYAIPAAILAGVKYRVHTVHNIASKEVDFARRILAKFFFKFNNVIPVSISPLVQESISKAYSLDKKNIPLVFNGTNLSNINTKSNYKTAGAFKLLHIGRFTPQKNHEVIINAVKQLKEEGIFVHVNFVGGAGNEDFRKLQVDELGLTDYVTFSGLQSNVSRFFLESDVFILPSKYEGMPITLIEAMGAGMPIIASAVGGVPDMIQHNHNGILIEPTVQSLVEAIKHLMADEKLRTKLVQNALVDSKKFSAEQMCRGYMNIYNQF